MTAAPRRPVLRCGVIPPPQGIDTAEGPATRHPRRRSTQTQQVCRPAGRPNVASPPCSTACRQQVRRLPKPRPPARHPRRGHRRGLAARARRSPRLPRPLDALDRAHAARTGASSATFRRRPLMLHREQTSGPAPLHRAAFKAAEIPCWSRSTRPTPSTTRVPCPPGSSPPSWTSPTRTSSSPSRRARRRGRRPCSRPRRASPEVPFSFPRRRQTSPTVRPRSSCASRFLPHAAVYIPHAVEVDVEEIEDRPGMRARNPRVL